MALQLLFKSDFGLMSLFVILFILCMAIYIFFFVRHKIHEEEHETGLRLER